MSRRIHLTEDKVSPSLYKKLLLLKTPDVQPLVSSLFKSLNARTKCYKLSDFNFNPHSIEYTMPNFFQCIKFAGTARLVPIEKAKQISLVKHLVELSNLIGHEITYEEMMDKLEECSNTSLRNNAFVEVIPEMIFAYTTQSQLETLIFKLEYFTGAEIMDIFEAQKLLEKTQKIMGSHTAQFIEQNSSLHELLAAKATSFQSTT